MNLMKQILEDTQIAQDAGFAKPKRKKQSALKMGMKHATKIQGTRAVKKALGNGLIGSIAALLMREGVNKMSDKVK